MEFYIMIAITVLLNVLKNPAAHRKVFPALAKIQVTAESLEESNPDYAVEVERQRKKQSGGP